MATPASDARFAVGIDLGTTNTALAYADVTSEVSSMTVMPIPQLVEPGEVAQRMLLPSFLYIVGEFDFPPGSLRLPWTPDDAPGHIVGELARKRGLEAPFRLVSSAKSWL